MSALRFRASLSSLAMTAIAGLCLVLAAGCPNNSKPPGSTSDRKAPPGDYHVDLPSGESRLGTAVVVVVDTSGSMSQSVKDRSGQRRPKYEIAREALARIIQSTAAWKKDHPKSNLQMAVYGFSSGAWEILPMGQFDPDKARAALNRLPAPGGGTAIGKALESAFQALYRSGCTRKFVVCITDGENTSGPDPDWVARHLFARTNGEVELQFVAFDTSAHQFRFLKDVNGHVVQAADGAGLEKELGRIYQERILVEKEEP
jgi:Mg-chelatase subunit ChlD